MVSAEEENIVLSKDLPKSPSETFTMLQKAYADNAMKKSGRNLNEAQRFRISEDIITTGTNHLKELSMNRFQDCFQQVYERWQKCVAAEAETELLEDTLTCGGCRKVFVLSNIVKFIHHKVDSCKKGNFVLFEDGDEDFDSDQEGPTLPPVVASSRPTSISAPICNRKGPFHHQQHLPHALDKRNRQDKLSQDPGLPTPSTPGASPNQEAGGISGTGGIGPSGTFFGHHALPKHEFSPSLEDKNKRTVEGMVVKVEAKEHTPRCCVKTMVDADTNTTISEPSTYTCSTCKQVFTSAWVLVQHAQHMHGIKIYVSTTGGRNCNSTPSSIPPATSAPPSLVPCSVNLALPPVMTSTSAINGQDHHSHHHVLPQQPMALDTHPALQLLRMPLGDRQFAPSLSSSSLFARPPSQDYRVDIQCSSGGSGDSQFHRLNHNPHHPHTAALQPLGISPFETHNPFDRSHLGLDSRPRPSPISLGFEPQMDFYSQRLRQLAGATSPTMAPSPRKLTPPFSHPPISSSSQPSTPTSTPQPSLPLHTSSNILPVSSHQQPLLHNQNQHQNKPQQSSASSTSSKGGEAPTSPKLLKSWSCEFCGKSFRFQSNLIVHRRSHTGEKPYKCPVCRHACSQASKLKRHMKTHQSNSGSNGNSNCNSKSPVGSTVSENNSLESARSTPDSASLMKDGHNRPRSHSMVDDDGSDGQTADNEEEEEDLDDEDDEEEEELDDDDDPEDSNEVMMAEDLSTRGPASSTPVPRSSSAEPHKSKSSIKEDSNSTIHSNNNNNNNNNNNDNQNGSNGIGSGGSGSVIVSGSRTEPRHSLLSEVMDKIGLSNIQHYNEAYQKALEESSGKGPSSFKSERLHPERESNASPSGPSAQTTAENGPERLPREEGNNNHHGNGKAMAQNSLELGHGFFGAFDHHPHHHLHPHSFDAAGKRMKMDIGEHVRERENLYAGLWLPTVHTTSVHRDLFLSGANDPSDLSRHNKSSSESALKSVIPTTVGNQSMSPRPGTSGGGNGSTAATSVTSLMLNASSGQQKTKEQRRNDTCEFCGKVFKNCSNLTVHRRSHTGEKPYKCELCSYACAQSSKLTRHMKTHGRLGKDVFRCRFCDMPFSVPSTLEKHMRKCVVNQNSTGVVFVDRDSDSKELT